MNRERIKIALYIAGFVFTVTFFFFAIYWLFFRTPGASVNGNENINAAVNALPNVNAANRNLNAAVNENANVALPNVNAGMIPDRIARGGNTETQLLVDHAVLDPTFAENTQDLVYYDADEDRFYRRSADGLTRTLLTEETFPEVDSVAWSPTGDKAVISFPDRSKVFYDFAKQKKATLPRELEDISFSPQGEKIAAKFIGSTEDDTWLTISNPDGTGAQIVEGLGGNADRVDVNWSPNQQVIATFSSGGTFSTEEIVFLGDRGQNFPSVEVPGRGFSAQWSSDGRQLLYSVYSDTTRNVPKLFFMDASGESFGTNHRALNLETWADKCTFSLSGTSVYCAVPTFLPAGSGTFRELAAGVPDDIYRIDLVNGSAERIARPVDSRGLATISTEKLLISPSEDVLYYTDANTGEIYSIKLRE